MSYILDALKRSEQERHQDNMPSFSAENMIIQTNQKKAHWWPYALIMVLILNALALFFFNSASLNEAELKAKTEELNTETSAQIKQSSASNSQRRAPPANVLKERQYIEPIKQASPASNWQSANNTESRQNDHLYGTTVDEGLLIKPKRKTIPSQINPADAPKKNDSINPNTVKEVKSEVNLSSDNHIEAPLLTELTASFQKTIPQLTFNSHIYSDKASQRRVMINDFYLKEGQSFDGIQLIVIGEAFIKVSKGGTIFKLPVLRDWAAR